MRASGKARFLLCPVGSRGDVQPLAAIALGLRDAGHDAAFCTTPDFRPWIEGQLGFELHAVGTDFQATLQASAEKLRNPIATLKAGMEVLRREMSAQFEGVARAARGADALVGIGLQLAGRSIAQELGIPYVAALPTPQPMPSGEYPALIFPAQGLPAWANLISHAVLGFVMDRVLLRSMNALRAARGLPPLAHAMHTFLSEHILLGVDEALFKPSPNRVWPFTQVPALIYPDTSALDPELARFIERGEPPVYLGFGSMSDPAPEQTFGLVTSVARALKRRFVFLPGAAMALPSDELCYVVRSAPHHLLFPRMAAVVHHGGAGTTATALRAGVPQLVVPHLSDQFFNGHRAHKCGVGPKPLPRAKLTRGRLLKEVARMLEDAALRQRAREVGSQLEGRTGVPQAVAHLEKIVRAG